MPWNWNPTVFDYEDADGIGMGRHGLSVRSHKYVASSADELTRIGISTHTGGLTQAAGRAALRQEIKEETIRQYMLGRGGRSMMTQTDWGSVGGMLTEQFRYLEKNVIPNLETMTEGQIRARMGMYANSGREAFFRGQARARGFEPNELPYQPADGNTICLTRCNCDWNYEPMYQGDILIGFDCYYLLGGSVQHCDTCIDRAAESAPFEIRFTSS